jgi:formate-dependent phosphoribosylglycinamide formyltransferase (GAR transformylase)
MLLGLGELGKEVAIEVQRVENRNLQTEFLKLQPLKHSLL